MSMNPWQRGVVSLAALAPAVATALLACGPALPPPGPVKQAAEPMCPTFSMLSSGPSRPMTNAECQPDRPTFNGLTVRALLRNPLTTNPKGLRFLLANPLDDGSFDGKKDEYINLQLTDPGAQAVMHDLVACALEPSEAVHYQDRVSGISRTWSGELGLCPQWRTGSPSLECQQRVSACLFARVNALHRKVAVSLGGPNFELHRQKAIDRVVTMLPKGDPQALLNEGTQIESFSRGWKRGYLGTCTPGRPVSLAVHGASECARTSLRVCEGVYGCNGPGAEGATPAYFLREKDGACQASPLTFTCPNSGTYGVMTKPEAAEIALHPSGGGAYPALEQDVFSYVEGAFFGNLFDPDGLTHFREVVLREGHLERRGGPVGGTGAEDDEDTVPHRHMYACFSLGVQEESSLSDEQGTAYLNDRVCAKPDAKKRCFPNPPKRCHFLDARKNEEVGYHCKWLSDIGAYESCRSDDGVSYVPATVRLHDPCSLIDNKELCDAIHGPPPVPR